MQPHIRKPDGSVGGVIAYDPHERVWNPPMPLLFPRRFSLEQRVIPGGTIADCLALALRDPAITDAAGRPPHFTPHDRRRMFITDAARHAPTHRPARRRPPRHQHHQGMCADGAATV